MSVEDRLARVRLEAPAGALRDRVLGAARSARREQHLFRWSLTAAAVALAAAIPVNLTVDLLAAPSWGPSPWPAEVREAGLARPRVALTRTIIPRTVEEIR